MQEYIGNIPPVELYLTAQFHPTEQVKARLVIDELADRLATVAVPDSVRAEFIEVAPPQPTPQERYGLTDRELEVIQLVAQGYTSGEIGEMLGKAEATIKDNVYKASLKVEARTRTHLVCLVLGLVDEA